MGQKTAKADKEPGPATLNPAMPTPDLFFEPGLERQPGSIFPVRCPWPKSVLWGHLGFGLRLECAGVGLPPVEIELHAPAHPFQILLRHLPNDLAG